MNTIVKTGDSITVYFSCGAASAVALQQTIKRYGSIASIVAVNNPIKEEHPDNRRFLADVERWLGIDITIVTHPKYPKASCEDIWQERQFMSSPYGAPCTQWLKKKARQLWETENPSTHIVLGFTADKKEKARHERFILYERSNVLPVLIEAGLTKKDCFTIINEAGIRLPEMYYLGYPNANCIGCVKATSPTYWNHVRNVHPEVFNERAVLSRKIGARLVEVKGERIFLDELDPLAKGRPMKSMQIDCGIFCEEKD